jgi:hypothetical protein
MEGKDGKEPDRESALIERSAGPCAKFPEAHHSRR